MLSRVRAGERFTPPHLSDTEPERDRSPIRTPSNSEDSYPEGYIPRTPGRDIPELQGVNSPSSSGLEEQLSPTPNRNIDEDDSPVGDTMADHAELPMDTAGPSGNKRPSDNPVTGNTAAKKAKAGSKSKLPGTAKPQSLEGTGDRSIVYLERPINPKTFVITTFKKQHKFLTFGLASQIITTEIADPAHKIYYLTTALAEIPVHKPVLYMNKSEFDTLPIGAEILAIKIDVVQRNALLSFATNASVSGLATLNQNKNGVYCIGLNKSGYGMDRTYTSFDDTEKMIPKTTGPPLYAAVDGGYEGLLEDFYGVDNTDPKFGESVAKHQVGMYTTLKNYFCLTQTDQYKGGWPNLQSKVIEYDAAAMVGEHILSYTYHPKMSPIKDTLKYLPCQVPFTNNVIPHGTLQSAFEKVTVTNNGTIADLAYSHDNRTAPVQTYDLYTDIEKAQHMVRGIGGTIKPVIQPSLHIGINPVPALTTSAIVDGKTNSNFTDTRSYFDVTCECVVGYRTYTDRPFATEYNCAAGEQVMQVNNIPNTNSVPFAQLYGTAEVPEA